MAPRRPDDPGPLRVGQIFRGQYEICGLIGRGGYAWVYEARHRFMGARVAIKIVPPSDSIDPNVFRRGQAEAQIQRTLLADEGIVRVDDAGITDDGLLYVVMELLKGRLIRSLLQEHGRLEIEEVLRLSAQIARTLGAAHDAGVIHRDFKPENVFVIGGNKIKVLDFGVAKVERAAWSTQRDMLLGTPVYMSPEQVLAGVITPASDVYALGTFIYEAISGHHPVRYLLGDRPVSLYWYTRIIAAEPAPPLREFVPNVPAYVAGLTSQMMAKKPERRFPSMHEALSAILHCLALYEREAVEGGVVLQTRDLSLHAPNAPRVDRPIPSSHPTAPAPVVNLLAPHPGSGPAVFGNVSSGLVANAQRIAESHRTEPFGTLAVQGAVSLSHGIDESGAPSSSRRDIQLDAARNATGSAPAPKAIVAAVEDPPVPSPVRAAVPSTQAFVRAVPTSPASVSRARALAQVLLIAGAFGFVLAGAGAILKPSLVRSAAPAPRSSVALALTLSSAVPVSERERRGEAPLAVEVLTRPSVEAASPVPPPPAASPPAQSPEPVAAPAAAGRGEPAPEQAARPAPSTRSNGAGERLAAQPTKQRAAPRAAAAPVAASAQDEPRLIDRLADIMNRREDEKRRADARSPTATQPVRVSSSAPSKTNAPPPVVKR